MPLGFERDGAWGPAAQRALQIVTHVALRVGVHNTAWVSCDLPSSHFPMATAIPLLIYICAEFCAKSNKQTAKVGHDAMMISPDRYLFLYWPLEERVVAAIARA